METFKIQHHNKIKNLKPWKKLNFKTIGTFKIQKYGKILNVTVNHGNIQNIKPWKDIKF